MAGVVVSVTIDGWPVRRLAVQFRQESFNCRWLRHDIGIRRKDGVKLVGSQIPERARFAGLSAPAIGSYGECHEQDRHAQRRATRT